MTGEIAGEKELSGYQGLLGGSDRAGGSIARVEEVT